MKSLGESVPLGRVKAPVWAESDVAEFGGPYKDGIEPNCKHDVIGLWDSNGHNFLDIIGYDHPDELQIVVDLINNYAPVMYAARDLLEVAESGGYMIGASKLKDTFGALKLAVEGKPSIEEDEEENEYTLGEILFDL